MTTSLRNVAWPATRRVVITGAAGGLGVGLARRFVLAGHEVLLTDINQDVHQVSSNLGVASTAVVDDLADPLSAERIVNAALNRWGEFDVLLNNASWSLHKKFEELKVDEIDRLIAINQRAPLLLTQQFARSVERQDQVSQDRIVVMVSSVNAVVGNPNLAAYAGTKGALEAMTRALAVELAPIGIRVNAVRPGVIDSPAFHDNIATGMLDAKSYWSDFLVKEPTEPDALAELMIFMVSSACRTLTGTTWTLDGGYTAQ